MSFPLATKVFFEHLGALCYPKGQIDLSIGVIVPEDAKETGKDYLRIAEKNLAIAKNFKDTQVQTLNRLHCTTL